MFVGSGIVTLGAILVAVPLGIAAAICLSDVIPFALRQWVKPVIEVLAAIPSVAYGFFALVVFAPLLQQRGGHLLAATVWIVGLPLSALAIVVFSDVATDRLEGRAHSLVRWGIVALLGAGTLAGLVFAGKELGALRIASGTNALNVSIILGIMALPTVVSVSEDALQAVGRELREGSYALGATRAETIVRTVLPAAGSGILAAVILGVMRAIGETMVVWMASGNAAQIPQPWWNFLEPVRTLTATIAGDMGEADHVTGSARYHVLFAMALCLLAFSFLCNLFSEWIIRRARKKVGG
jgi:phosphate transport system permease protein